MSKATAMTFGSCSWTILVSISFILWMGMSTWTALSECHVWGKDPFPASALYQPFSLTQIVWEFLILNADSASGTWLELNFPNPKPSGRVGSACCICDNVVVWFCFCLFRHCCCCCWCCGWWWCGCFKLLLSLLLLLFQLFLKFHVVRNSCSCC